jgi:hypothetical protein
VTPRIERSKYQAASDRIQSGSWIVDAEHGAVLGVLGQPIGWLDADGFTRVGLVLEGRVRAVIRARLIWESVHGPVPDGYEVGHRGDHRDDAIASLELKRPGRRRGSRNLRGGIPGPFFRVEKAPTAPQSSSPPEVKKCLRGDPEERKESAEMLPKQRWEGPTRAVSTDGA